MEKGSSVEIRIGRSLRNYYHGQNKLNIGFYRPVSLTSEPGKLMKQTIFSVITQYLKDNQVIRLST